MKVMIYSFPYISIFFPKRNAKKIILNWVVFLPKDSTFLELTCIEQLLIKKKMPLWSYQD